MAVRLYNYQKQAYRDLVRHFKTNNRALAVMASGLGKTILAAFWAKTQLKKGKGLFLCHDNGILEQAMTEFRKVLGKKVSFGIFTGQEKESEDVDILFASFQCLRNWSATFAPDEFQFIIVDESHHGQAPTFKKVIDYFKPEKLLGITATPDRMDGLDIREIFGDEVVNYSLEKGIAKSWLTPVEYHVLTDELNTEALREMAQKVLKKGQRISVKQLNETIFVRARDERIAEIILGYDKKTIIFCESILHAEHFQQFIPGCSVYHSERTDKKNHEALRAFRKGRSQYILAIDKFNEGIDVPDTEMVVFLRCTDSRTIFFQQLGRGLRKISRKKKVIVLDFVANCDRLIMVKELADAIKTIIGDPKLYKDVLHLSGTAFDFFFSDEQLDIFKVLEKLQPRHISDIPELLAEYSKKNPFPADQVIAGTGEKLWWKCRRCGYEWQATGNNRVRGHGCAACANQVVTKTNNLTATHPELAKEYSKKNPLPVNRVVAGTGKKLWWKCRKCKHEWQATGNHRVQGYNCPACYGNKIVTSTKNLTATHPKLTEEYSSKNTLPANQIRAGTDKKLWWKCQKCKHEWQTSGSNRIQGCGCPKCAIEKRKETRKKNREKNL